MIKFLKSKILHIVIFITGACSLILEILATRLLSPFFGNTIYTFSSVIGTVLAALSLGYFIGGNLADKQPTHKKLFTIILLSGLATFILDILETTILPKLGYKLPINTGPLVASLLLFAFPSFLLGMLSPYTISLEKLKNKKKGVGKISGEIFFVSTLGSIGGTFLAGFYLIPGYGLNSIVYGVGFTLSVIGILGLIISNGFQDIKKNFFDNKLVSIFIFLALISFYANKISLPNAVYSKDGVYEKIMVLDSKYKGVPARVLIQDRSWSSAINPEDPKNLLFDYTRYIDLYKLVGKTPQNALFIGGGAYTMPNYLLRNVPDIKIDVTEIEPELYNIAKKYFWFKDNYRLVNHTEDGRRFLHDSDSKYDIIFSDVYSTIYSIPTHFTTEEFFRTVKDHLSPNGIFMANIIGDLSRQKDSLIFSEIKTISKVFPNTYLFAVDDPATNHTQNIIFMSLNTGETLNFEEISRNFKDDPILSNLKAKLVNQYRFNSNTYLLLKDNYAPVENITIGLIKRTANYKERFNGEEALGTINHLVGMGSRHVGSIGHDNALKLIVSESDVYADKVIVENWNENVGGKSYGFSNIIARTNPDLKKRIILGSHYDSLFENPGANNSASGVAVLLEMMRHIKNSEDKPDIGIDFVFFDGEEGIPGSDWKPYGSTYLASHLKDIYKSELPKSAIILDMICDKDLDIYYESNSLKFAKDQTEKLMSFAKESYPDNFYAEPKYSIDDDHSALNAKGIPSTLLIDFDYLYYNTPKDTPDKCSPKSLEQVGNTVIKYVYSM